MRDVPYELARRVFKLRPTAIERVERHKDLLATMSDGAVLLADHYVPDGDITAPLVLVRSPYGRRGAFGLVARTLAYEGFQVVMQSCRGTEGSGGRYDRPFRAEVGDGRDTVEWLRRQSFFPGRFATYSGSYLGYVQLALPPESKSDLFGAVLQIAPSSTHDVVWTHGGLALSTSLGWSTGANRNDTSLRGAIAGRRDPKRVRAAGMRAPLLQSYTAATTTRVGFLEQWWTHPDHDDPFWAEEDQRASLDSYDCPVLVQSGWYDLFLESSVAQYERLAGRGADVRLTVGPWTHETFTRAMGRLLPEAADFLKAAYGAAPALSTPPVTVLDARNGAETRLTAWPPPSSPEEHFLGASTLRPTAPTTGSTSSTFVYDPADPTPQFGGALLEPGGGPVDNAALERRADVLTFDTPACTDTPQFAGRPTLELWVSADVPAPQLFVRLNVVDAGGVSKNLTDTLVTVPGGADAGVPVRVVAALPPTFVRLAAGERIRLLIAGGSFPQYARSPGSGESPATASELHVARISIHHDAEHPSRVTLPRATPAP
ncbi:MAG: CocE/NonD family hydrolase [Ilumatobacteraceae bacterium]